MDEFTKHHREMYERQIAELTHEISDLNEFNGYLAHQLHIARLQSKSLQDENRSLKAELSRLEADRTYVVGGVA